MLQLAENCDWPYFHIERWLLITADWYAVIDLASVILWVPVNAGYQEQFAFFVAGPAVWFTICTTTWVFKWSAWYHNSVRWTLNRWPEPNSNARVTHYIDAIFAESNCEIIVFEALSFFIDFCCRNACGIKWKIS